MSVILQGLLLLLATLLVYFVGRQIGRERGLMHNSLVCQTLVIQQQSQPFANRLFSVQSIRKCKSTFKNIPSQKFTGLCPRPNPETTHPMHVVKGKASTPDDVFSFLHHPSSPSKFNFYLSQDSWRAPNHVATSPCKEVYLTRTGSRGNQPNKCVAVAIVPQGYEPMNQQSYRVGYTALNTNQYQQDFPRAYSKKPTAISSLLQPLLLDLTTLTTEFKHKMGDPIDPTTGQRRHVIVMVANEGVIDLLLNFLCSTEGAQVDRSSVVVFVGDERFVNLIESFGAHAIYSSSLGSMPKQAAGFYMDNTFSRMMWFKTTSVYLALRAGFEVLFQDVDLVWLRSPYKHFAALPHDVIFMDDGARTPRYTPFFVNSGFYFVKHNVRTLYLFETFLKHAPEEIGLTHSHQSVLIRHIAEAHHLFSLRVFVLDQNLFASGQTYHENKPLVRQIQAHKFTPYVFHMCWTDNRENKLVYFKDIGLWYLSENDPTCLSAANMMESWSKAPEKSLLDRCCQRHKYWPSDALHSATVEEDTQIANMVKVLGTA
jgi:hypothetical protein